MIDVKWAILMGAASVFIIFTLALRIYIEVSLVHRQSKADRAWKERYHQ
jgi:hypothetical protein